MNCESVTKREWTEAYLMGQLSGSERKDYEKHLATCERCREGLEAERQIIAVIRAGARDEMKKEIRREALQFKAGKRLNWVGLAKIAAVLFLFVTIPSLVYVYKTQGPSPVSVEELDIDEAAPTADLQTTSAKETATEEAVDRVARRGASGLVSMEEVDANQSLAPKIRPNLLPAQAKKSQSVLVEPSKEILTEATPQPDNKLHALQVAGRIAATPGRVDAAGGGLVSAGVGEVKRAASEEGIVQRGDVDDAVADSLDATIVMSEAAAIASAPSLTRLYDSSHPDQRKMSDTEIMTLGERVALLEADVAERQGPVSQRERNESEANVQRLIGKNFADTTLTGRAALLAAATPLKTYIHRNDRSGAEAGPQENLRKAATDRRFRFYANDGQVIVNIRRAATSATGQGRRSGMPDSFPVSVLFSNPTRLELIWFVDGRLLAIAPGEIRLEYYEDEVMRAVIGDHTYSIDLRKNSTRAVLLPAE